MLLKEPSVAKMRSCVEQGSSSWDCMVSSSRLIVGLQVPSQILVRFQLGLGSVRQFLSVTGQTRKPFISLY